MTYKFSDILRMIIPGLYFITLSLGISVDLEIIRIDEATPFLKLLTSTFANVIARIQQASAKLRNVFVKALLWC